jgi:hypothetical protein
MRCAGAGSFRGLPAHARVTLAHRLVGVAYGSDFNFDYCVSFTPEQFAESEAYYDYEVWPITVSNASGISVFYKNGRGEVFQTRSCYLRALTFQWRPPFLDLVPKTAMRRALDLDGADAPGTISIEAVRRCAFMWVDLPPTAATRSVAPRAG